MPQTGSILETMTEQQFIKKNLAVIRAYLKGKFPDCVITEESIPNTYHKFIVANAKIVKRYKLKVSWVRLSDRNHPPEKTRVELNRIDVAGSLVLAADRGEGWFYW
jgi:hypothetical protein